MNVMLSIERKEIAVNKLVMAMHCLHGALASASTERDAERNRSRKWTRDTVLGQAAHKIMAGKEEEAIIDLLQDEAPELPREEVAALVEQARKVVERVNERRGADGKDLRKERTVTWTDSQTGWTIFSQPDRVEVLSDEAGEYVAITDLKFPKRVRERHIQTVRIFGLIFFMLLRGRDARIKLIVECLKEEHAHGEWFGPLSEILDLLERVQDTLQRLEEAARSDKVVPRTVGNHCFACKLRETCNQGRKYIARTRPNTLPVPLTELLAADAVEPRGRDVQTGTSGE